MDEERAMSRGSRGTSSIENARMSEALPLIHLDDTLIVADKPSGLLAVPGRGEHLSDCLAARIQASYADALVVHRLDQATSGLMLFARGAAAQRALSLAFAHREIDKRYVAVVAGAMLMDEGTIELPLMRDWPNRPRQIVHLTQGKPSTTHWRVLHRDASTTRVELEPLTGRSHQLRVHLQAIGHPIVGDALYAPPEIQAMAPRLLLHASALAFTHPASGEGLRFASDALF
jgi:tRNA pseudouridine32 synthase / 23S rRNA pseudouridine746 synthase